MTFQQLVGKYVKQVDPEMVSRMRADGYRTDAATVGRYVQRVDPEMYVRIVANLIEDEAARTYDDADAMDCKYCDGTGNDDSIYGCPSCEGTGIAIDTYTDDADDEPQGHHATPWAD
jgi:RecJ-like exonuclease